MDRPGSVSTAAFSPGLSFVITSMPDRNAAHRFVKGIVGAPGRLSRAIMAG